MVYFLFKCLYQKLNIYNSKKIYLYNDIKIIKFDTPGDLPKVQQEVKTKFHGTHIKLI